MNIVITIQVANYFHNVVDLVLRRKVVVLLNIGIMVGRKPFFGKCKVQLVENLRHTFK